MKKLFRFIPLVALSVGLLALPACTTQNKTTYQHAATGAAIVDSGDGVVLYPADYVSVTNGAGQVLTYAKYAAILTTNRPPFSLAGFFTGYGGTLTAYRDTATEKHTGSGRALLADSKYTQLTSDFESGTRFSGKSALAVGSIELTINTNAISATGNAGNQLIHGLGSAAGQFLNKGVTGKP